MIEEIETEKRKTPEEYEQSYLPTLEEQDNLCTSEVQNFCTNLDHIASHQEIMYIIGRVEEYKKYFLSYQSLANYLDNAGRPKMLKRLNEILKDSNSAIQIFQKMDQNLLNATKEIFRIQRDMQQYGCQRK
jgi:hypothetical protein